MIFFSLKRTLFYGLCASLFYTSAYGMTTETTTQTTINHHTLENTSWNNALSTAVKTTLLVGPAVMDGYAHARQLSGSHQQEIIGDQAVKADLEAQIRAAMAEQHISDADTIKIFAMRDAKYAIQLDESHVNNAAVPIPYVQEVQSTFKHNALGVYVTNKAIFIDEDIINFETNELLSKFLVTHALQNLKNNTYQNILYGKIGLGFLRTAALYKTIPFIAYGAQKLTHAIGFTSFNDANKGGFLLGATRFVINDVMCQIIAQSIVQKISSHALSLYKKAIKCELDETMVGYNNIMPLIVEFSTLVVAHEKQRHIEASFQDLKINNHAVFAGKYLGKLCVLADTAFHTNSIVDWLNDEIARPHHDAIMKEFLEHIKNTFAHNPNDAS